MDALLLAPLNPASYAHYARRPSEYSLWMGKNRVESGALCTWCIAAGEHNFYLAPGLMGTIKRGSKSLADALTWINQNYDPNVFNIAGPMALTIAAKGKSEVAMLPAHWFYPVEWERSDTLFRAKVEQQPPWRQSGVVRWARIKRQGISLHLYGGTTGKLDIEPRSPVWYALREILNVRVVWIPPYLASASNSISLRPIRVTRMFGTRLLFELEVKHGLLGEDRTLCIEGDSEAAVNAKLDSAVYHAPSVSLEVDEMSLKLSRVTTDGIREVFTATLPIYHLPSCLTVLIKTMGRMHKVLPLIESIQRYYPGVKILVGDDGDKTRLEESVDAEQQRGFWLIRLPWDVGLAEGRNLLLKRVQTPMVLFLDDDFLLNEFSDLGRLVHACWHWKYEVAAGKSPRDWEQWHFDYAARMRVVKGGRLLLMPSNRGVHIVPNVMVGMTTKFKELGWDGTLKVGEHEDFFWRAKLAGWRVASLRSVEFLHEPEKASPEYQAMRDRAPLYQSQFLRKHSLRTLIGWGNLTMHLDELERHDLIDLWFERLMPFSVQIGWSTPVFHHRWSVEALSLHGDRHTKELTVGARWLWQTPPHEHEIMLTGLNPSTAYRITLRAGNHTHWSPEPWEPLYLRTPSLKMGNLLRNPCFHATPSPWYPILGTVAKSVEVILTEQSRWHLQPSRFLEDWSLRSSPNLDLAMALWSGLGHLQAEKVVAPPRAICQTISVHCPHPHCQVLVSGWAHIDHAINTHGIIPLLELRVSLGPLKWSAPWQWYRHHTWQLATLQFFITNRAENLTVCGWMEMTMGAIFLDNFYLTVRPYK